MTKNVGWRRLQDSVCCIQYFVSLIACERNIRDEINLFFIVTDNQILNGSLGCHRLNVAFRIFFFFLLCSAEVSTAINRISFDLRNHNLPHKLHLIRFYGWIFFSHWSKDFRTIIVISAVQSKMKRGSLNARKRTECAQMEQQ